ncbi:MAG: hypothetical protein RLY86_2956 [Pseudomonadota bacterium]|jgi:phosphoribosyl 1,2-cyclic phosphodiesterase
MDFSVTFWGVRGTFPCAYSSHLGYGGNTSCVEVRAGDTIVILDAGTGLRRLGKRFLRDGVKRANLLMTHAHWDHIAGFPFFEPGYRPDFGMDVFSRDLKGCDCIGDVLSECMENPLFPVPLTTMRADLRFRGLHAGDRLDLAPGLVVRTAPLNHPGGAIGYRIEYGGKSFCYVTDTEHVPGQPDENILALIEGADIVAYDACYTDAEFEARRGWGHSTPAEGIRLARAAEVGALCLFHHDPDHDDAQMSAIEREAQGQWANVFAAREGTAIDMMRWRDGGMPVALRSVA